MYEQNIDDILKQLKDSVNQDESIPKTVPDGSIASQAHISEESLKQQLRQQYATDVGASSEPEITEYALDQELVQEMIASSVESEGPEEESVVLESQEEIALQEEIEELEGEAFAELEELKEIEVEEITASADEETFYHVTAENEQPEPEETADQAVLTLLDQERQELFEAEETAEESFKVEDLLLSKTEAESFMEQEELSEEQEFPEIESVSLTEMLKDYESIPAENEQVSFDDESEALLSVMEDIPGAEETVQKDSSDVSLHASVLDLMTQLGCEEELDAVSEEEISEEFTLEREDGVIDREEQCAAHLESIRNTYRHCHTLSLVKLLGMVALTLLVFFYDTLPLFGVEFFGIADYDAYPGAYVLIGMQLMILAAVLLWKPMLQGLQKMFTLHPDLYSLVAMAAVMTLFYDFAAVFSMSEFVPPMFHFLCVLLMTALGIGEYALLRREMKMFAVCTDEGDQYTLTLGDGTDSVTKILYEGGVPMDKRVYIPGKADSPQISFPMEKKSVEEHGRFLAAMMWLSLLLSISAAIVSIMLRASLEMACLSAMCMLFTVLPLCMIAATLIPVCASAWRLHKRGIVLDSTSSMKQYAKADILVFQDVHLFQKCDPKKTGIVFYEQSQTAAVMGGLQLLYAQIGGPLADIFEEIPEEFRFEKLRVCRITKNGIEAIVNQQHMLLVGDHAFMKRYGLSFPENAEQKGRVCVCVSLDGKVSAKISAKYSVEPVFEMLTERLAKEGIECVVETYDPMIQGAFVASVRSLGTAPIAIVHKNAEAFGNRAKKHRLSHEEAGLFARMSRLKLAEAVIWCKRFVRIQKSNVLITGILGVCGVVLTSVMLGMGRTGILNQYWLLLFLGITNVIVCISSWIHFPKKSYFTVERLEKEIIADQQKQQRKLNRLHAKKKEKERKKIHE